ncbi:hypothetical protein BDV30DRAFT_206489 [Aspergillus minisclerotigenes]|uniref:Uncharacterized protein n=1 Tax=Aspergillus minisclerotigenes TaxID=656917 RepID=A0A5N6JBV5_9EURO|nr:hypothetical protein BDV30DRAFT_206489 [Aspergillus minisclerotigenes]
MAVWEPDNWLVEWMAVWEPDNWLVGWSNPDDWLVRWLVVWFVGRGVGSSSG